jgi:hypothetical protein
MRLYHPHHPGVTPYNELGELDYRDPEFIVVLNSAICIIQYQFASVLALTGSRSSNVISGSFYFRVFGFGSPDWKSEGIRLFLNLNLPFSTCV